MLRLFDIFLDRKKKCIDEYLKIEIVGNMAIPLFQNDIIVVDCGNLLLLDCVGLLYVFVGRVDNRV